MNHIIIIPFRNRENHLKYFMENSVPLLKKHLINLKIVIVEQANDKLFNRGALINIGFNDNLNNNTLYFTHDVDVNPNEDTIVNYYINNNLLIDTIKGIYTSKCNTLGGIICFNKNTFQKINGFPNNYWGWGTEDKALQNRAEFYKITIQKNIISNSELEKTSFTIFNDNHNRTHENLSHKTDFEYRFFHHLANKEKETHILNSGLNNLSYNVIERKQINDFIEHIKVDF